MPNALLSCTRVHGRGKLAGFDVFELALYVDGRLVNKHENILEADITDERNRVLDRLASCGEYDEVTGEPIR